MILFVFEEVVFSCFVGGVGVLGFVFSRELGLWELCILRCMVCLVFELLVWSLRWGIFCFGLFYLDRIECNLFIVFIFLYWF